MIYLVTAYSILSTVAAALDLLHGKPVAAFCVAILSAAAFIGGRELKTGLTGGGFVRGVGRIITGAILLAVSLWLSHYRIDLFYYSVAGLHWCIAGIAVGFFAGGSGHVFLPKKR